MKQRPTATVVSIGFSGIVPPFRPYFRRWPGEIPFLICPGGTGFKRTQPTRVAMNKTRMNNAAIFLMCGTSLILTIHIPRR